MQRLAIDHVFLFVAPDGPERHALQRIGLVETYQRQHPGQGTANACFAFDNLFLELLWLTSPADARSAPIARTRLWERSQWRALGACPLGIAVRGDLAAAGVTTWDYRPPYLQHLLPAGAGLPVATLSDDPAQPMLFTSPGQEPPIGWPAARRGVLQNPAGWGPVLAVEVWLTPEAAAAAHWPRLAAACDELSVAVRPGGRWGLRLTLGARTVDATGVMELVCTDTGGWSVSATQTP